MLLCVSVFLSHTGTVSKELHGSSCFLVYRLLSSYTIMRFKEIRVSQKIREIPSGLTVENMARQLSASAIWTASVVSLLMTTPGSDSRCGKCDLQSTAIINFWLHWMSRFVYSKLVDWAYSTIAHIPHQRQLIADTFGHHSSWIMFASV